MTEKSTQIEKLRKFVNAPRVQVGGITALNLCDIYINSSERELVLSTIQRRFPHTTGDIDAPDDWYKKLASLKSEQSYINAFTGHFGEDKAIERLNELGIESKPFESLIHKDNDLVAKDGTAYSVKSYSSESNFLGVVKEHPDSSNYIINSDLYEKLNSSGQLTELNNSGNTVIDGGWQHLDAVDMAQARLGSISSDIYDELYDGVIDDVPLVGAIVILCNLGADLYKYANDRITTHEMQQNASVTAGKIAATGSGAAAGGAMGATIGSAIFPLAGTLIGAGVGSFIGGIYGRRAADSIGKIWKWGSSIAAYRHFYKKYGDGWGSANQSIQNRFFKTVDIENDLQVVSSTHLEFEDQLDLSSTVPVSLQAVLIDESKQRLERSLEIVKRATEKVQTATLEFAIDWGIQMNPRKRKKAREASELLYGAILAENAEWLFDLSPEDHAIVNQMKDEMRQSPNIPLKLNVSKQQILKALAIAQLEIEGRSNE